MEKLGKSGSFDRMVTFLGVALIIFSACFMMVQIGRSYGLGHDNQIQQCQKIIKESAAKGKEVKGLILKLQELNDPAVNDILAGK